MYHVCTHNLTVASYFEKHAVMLGQRPLLQVLAACEMKSRFAMPPGGNATCDRAQKQSSVNDVTRMVTALLAVKLSQRKGNG